MKIPCLVESIFFRSKLEAMLSRLGHEAVFVEAVGAFAGYQQVIVDGAHPLAEKAVYRYPLRCRVFIRHTDTEGIKKLKGFGCEHVYARSDFFPQLQRLLSV